MRHVVTSEREREYMDAVFCPARDGVINSDAIAQEVVWVRNLFVNTLGWSREQLERYPFRALSATARPGQRVYAQLKGPADYAAELPLEFLELTLKEVAALPQGKRHAYVQSALMPDAVEVANYSQQSKTKFIFTDSDRAYIKKLAAQHGIEMTERDYRLGDTQLKRAILFLLKLAYERGQ